MIFQTPLLEEEDIKVLALLQEQRNQLKQWDSIKPKRWFGTLRKTSFAKAIQGSNSIEGYHTTIDNAVAAVMDEPTTADDQNETWKAIVGYRDALTYIYQTADDPDFLFSSQYLKSLHFMMMNFDMEQRPGRWRLGNIFVVNRENGETVYTAPPVENVNTLINELISNLNSDHALENVIIRAAMAHLNLTMIHPFKDGNGRMARALQTMVLANEQVLHPIFSSIEEWLGANTEEYYRVLAEVGQGSWNPQRSALPWIRFCLKAHYQQAGTTQKRVEEYSRIFVLLQEEIKKTGIDDRVVIPLMDATLGLKITNARYRLEADVSEYVAVKDLKNLCEHGLLEPIGANRGRYYVATKKLLEIRQKAKQPWVARDPYTIIQEAERAKQLNLPSLEKNND